MTTGEALIVVGGGRGDGYVLERLARRHRIVLLSPRPWERPYITDHVPVEAGDGDGAVAAAAEVARQRPVGGVVTYHEACVELAARIGEAIGVPHCDRRAAARCGDRFAAREAFGRSRVPSARFLLVHTPEEARTAADQLGFPVVVKPRAPAAGFGASLVNGEDELDCAVRRVGAGDPGGAWAFRSGVLIEEYLDGPEIGVDCAVRDGVAEPLVFAKKLLGFAPYFEELGRIVAGPEQVADDPGDVQAAVAAAHRALGIDTTVTHTVVRLTADGPRVVGIDGRPSGETIRLAHVATGLDLAVVSAQIATGGEPDLSAPRRGVAGIRFFHASAPGRVLSAEMAEGLSAPWLHEVTWLAGPGEEVRPVPGRPRSARVGHAIVTAGSVEECATRMRIVEDGHRFAVTPSR